MRPSIHFVMLNLFQHPCLIRVSRPDLKWTLKQVQGDEGLVLAIAA
jgi:hypothetical protein